MCLGNGRAFKRGNFLFGSLLRAYRIPAANMSNDTKSQFTNCCFVCNVLLLVNVIFVCFFICCNLSSRKIVLFFHNNYELSSICDRTQISSTQRLSFSCQLFFGVIINFVKFMLMFHLEINTNVIYFLIKVPEKNYFLKFKHTN